MLSDPRFTIGADPELFCVGSNGEYISAVNKFGGTKYNPKILLPGGFFIQEDNVAVEFNIPPATSDDMFVDHIQKALLEIERLAKNKGLFLSITASASFPSSQLRTKASRYFGCEADYNAWLMKMNSIPHSTDKNLRSCGGHIHLGWLDHFRNPFHIIRWLDLYVAVPLTLIDKDTRRRELYGQAGAFREKPYGVEYRTLSNFWLSSPNLIRWVYSQVVKAVESYDLLPEETLESSQKTIQKAINFGDLECYRLLASNYDLSVPPQ